MMTRTIQMTVGGVALATACVLSAFTELRRASMPVQSEEEYAAATRAASLVVKADMQFKGSKAKYNYKEDTPEDAQQSWTVNAEYPTQYTDLDQVSSFRMQGRKTGNANALDHSFAVKPGSVDEKGTKLKMKFFPWDKSGESPKSGGSLNKYMTGQFLAWLKVDKKTGARTMKIAYSIKKANEGDLLVRTNRFAEMKQQVAASNRYSSTVPLECAFSSVGTVNEAHDGAASAKYKATTKGGSGGL